MIHVAYSFMSHEAYFLLLNIGPCTKCHAKTSLWKMRFMESKPIDSTHLCLHSVMNKSESIDVDWRANIEANWFDSLRQRLFVWMEQSVYRMALLRHNRCWIASEVWIPDALVVFTSLSHTFQIRWILRNGIHMASSVGSRERWCNKERKRGRGRESIRIFNQRQFFPPSLAKSSNMGMCDGLIIRGWSTKSLCRIIQPSTFLPDILIQHTKMFDVYPK